MGDATGKGPPRFTVPLPNINLVEGSNAKFAFPSELIDNPNYADDPNPLVYRWTIVDFGGGAFPQWLSGSSTSPTLGGVVPVGSSDYRITLTLTNSSGSTSSTFTLFTTGPSNQPPRLVAPLQDQIWSEGAPAAYVVPGSSFADPDGDAMSYRASLVSGAALPSWLVFDAATRTFSGTPPTGSDDVTVRLSVSDSKGLSTTADLLVRTTPASQVNGTAGPDSLVGTTAADTFNALSGDDTIDGGLGNDEIDGGPGADRLNGGLGEDRAIYAGNRANFLLSRNSAGSVTVADKFGVMDSLSSIESLQIGSDSIPTSTLSYQPAVTLPPSTASNVVYRFYNVRDKAYFYTNSVPERDNVVRESTDANYTPENGVWPYFYQGATFTGANSGGGSVPVYRFYNTQTGHHFFTLNESERAMVIRESTDPSFTPENGVWPFKDEGVGYLAYADAGHAGTVPVFRFYNPTLNRHLYTASTDEAQQIRLTGQWNDEGVGFWGGGLSPNRSPTVGLFALANQSWPEGLPGGYVIPASAFTDPDGDTLTFTAALTTGGSLPSWLSLNSESRTLVGTPPAGSGDVAVRISAADGRGGSIFSDFVISTPASSGSDDFKSDIGTTGRTTEGGSTTGSIEVAGDRDWFRVSLIAGRTYTVDLEGLPSGQGTLSNPYLYGFYDAFGTAVANTENNDIGSKNLNSRATYTATSTGDYFLSAGGSGSAVGTYTLRVSAADDYAATVSTTGTVSASGSVTGTIEGADDRDWFRVSLTAGTTYTINLEGTATNRGTLSDPLLYGIYTADGSLLPNTTNDDVNGSKNLNSSVSFTPSSSGNYFIAASASGSATGTYTLSVGTGGGGSTNRAPVVANALSDLNWVEGLTSNYQFSAAAFSDLDGDALTYSAALATGGSLPSWLSLNSSTRTFNGIAPAGSSDFTVRVTASDGRGGSTFDDFVIFTPGGSADDYAATTSTTGRVVAGGSTTGSIETAGDRDWFRVSLSAGSTYTINLSAAVVSQGSLNDPYLYGIYTSGGSLLPNTSNDDANGSKNLNASVSFTPSSSGDYFIAAGASGTGTGSYTLSVGGGGGGGGTTNRAPVVANALSDLNWSEGFNGVYQFSSTAFSDPDGDGLTYLATLATGGSLPSWLTLDSSTRTFAGTAPVNSGDFTVRVTASDGRGGSTFDDFVVFTPTGSGSTNQAPVVDNALFDLNWVEGVNGTYQFSAAAFSDPDGDSLTYTAALATGGSLPNWLSLSGSTRTFSGTAPVGSSDFTVRVTASDGRGGSTFDDFVVFTPTAGSSDDYAGSTSTTGLVVPGGSATGSIETANDRDWFRVSLSSGRTYTINLEGSPNGQGTLSDPYLYGVYSSGGKLQSNSSNDDANGSKNRNSSVSFAPSTSGDYFISAGGSGSATGTYKLSVSSGTKASTSASGPIDASGGDYVVLGPSAGSAPASVPVVLTGLLRADPAAGAWDVHGAFGVHP